LSNAAEQPRGKPITTISGTALRRSHVSTERLRTEPPLANPSRYGRAIGRVAPQPDDAPPQHWDPSVTPRIANQLQTARQPRTRRPTG